MVGTVSMDCLGHSVGGNIQEQGAQEEQIASFIWVGLSQRLLVSLNLTALGLPSGEPLHSFVWPDTLTLQFIHTLSPY